MKVSTAMILKRVSLPAKILPKSIMTNLRCAVREAYKYTNNFEAMMANANHMLKAAKFGFAEERSECINLAKELIQMKAHHDPRKLKNNETYGQAFSKLIKQLLHAGYNNDVEEIFKATKQFELQQHTEANFMRQAIQENLASDPSNFYLINMKLEYEQNQQKPEQADICSELVSTMPSCRY